MTKNFDKTSIVFFILSFVLLGIIEPLYFLFHAGNIPFWDAWDATLPFYKNFHIQGLSWQELWQAHNNHRLVLTKLIYLFDYIFFAGSRIPILLLSYGFLLGSYCIFALNLLKDIPQPKSVRLILLGILAQAVFSYCQWDMYTWAFIIQQSMTLFFFLAAVFLVGKAQNSTLSFFALLLLSLMATLSSLNGLLVWIAVIVLMLFYRFRKKQIIVYTFFAIAIYIAYFYNNAKPVGYAMQSIDTHVSIFQRIHYVMAFFGSIWFEPVNATIFGGLLLLVFAASLLFIFDRNIPGAQYRRFCTWAAVVVLPAGSAILGAIGRVADGWSQAHSGRYLPLQSPAVCAILVLAALVLLFYKVRFNRLLSIFVKFKWLILIVLFLYLGLSVQRGLLNKRINTPDVVTFEQAVLQGVFLSNVDAVVPLPSEYILPELQFLKDNNLRPYQAPIPKRMINRRVELQHLEADNVKELAQTVISLPTLKWQGLKNGYAEGFLFKGSSMLGKPGLSQLYFVDEHGKVYGMANLYYKIWQKLLIHFKPQRLYWEGFVQNDLFDVSETTLRVYGKKKGSETLVQLPYVLVVKR